MCQCSGGGSVVVVSVVSRVMLKDAVTGLTKGRPHECKTAQ